MFSTRQGLTHLNFANIFDADKTRMIGLPCGEKNYDNTFVKPFSSDTGTSQTDGQTDRIAISISHVSVLMCDKNDNSDFDLFVSRQLQL